MKRFTTIALLLAFTGGCVSSAETESKQQAHERSDAYAAVLASAEADYGANNITFGQMVARVTSARIASLPNDTFAAEESYFARLQGARVDKGEITIDEYRYTLSQKINEIAAKRHARAVQTVAAIAALESAPASSPAPVAPQMQFQSTYQPIYPQSQRLQANCRSQMVFNQLQTVCN
ncbi:hypothetical protein [Bosea vaviloviae]|uniref:Lipoprotein n=1 Tax=Bosea vaviloviae TaxID=1526658 RepID=A0A1D7U2V5_9HYPH|nr:hypothetical protein [Bosea vaviloviae]AOO81672.1 hypothetical protein BHK69_15500 [Bosea vaviloviae]